jgi:hypothetical protein
MLSTKGCFQFILLLFTIASQVIPTSTAVLPADGDLISKRQAPSRWFYYGITATELTDIIEENNARITQLRVVDPNTPTFAVSLVENTGSFGTAWWWWWGQEGSDINNLLSGTPAKRIISMDPYVTSSGQTLFALVMVENEGVNSKSWWYYYGYDGATLGSLLSGKRLIEVRPYLESGNRVFAAVAIENSGADSTCWEWWYGESIQFISSQISSPSACSGSMHVTNLAPDPTGGWVAILTQQSVDAWWWWYGISPATVLSNLGKDKDSNGYGSRLVDISPYNSGNSYASVEISDESPPQDCEI